jgi:hypothetical protein
MGKGEVLHKAKLTWFVGLWNDGQRGSLEGADGGFKLGFGERA